MITPVNAAHWQRHDFVARAAKFSFAVSHRDSGLAPRRRFVVMVAALACWVGCGAANAEEQSRYFLLLDAYNNTLPAPETFSELSIAQGEISRFTRLITNGNSVCHVCKNRNAVAGPEKSRVNSPQPEFS